MENYHQPVLLNACIEGLNIDPNGVYVDVTFGGGGHSKAILEKLDKDGKLFAFDKDHDATKNITTDERLIFIDQDFKYMQKFLRLNGIEKVNGILADLGVSSHQINIPDRGFSTRFEGEIDMRMNQSQSLSAKEVLNTYEEEQLKHIIKTYGEIKYAGRIATAIIAARPLSTTNDLVAAVEHLLKGNKNKELAKLFQAIRIEVNNELESLEALLEQSEQVLVKGGRLVVMSYHSLEDRLVKNYIRAGNFTGEVEKDFYGNAQRVFKKINGKVIIADQAEIKKNSRARSAKLRIAEKI